MVTHGAGTYLPGGGRVRIDLVARVLSIRLDVSLAAMGQGGWVLEGGGGSGLVCQLAPTATLINLQR